MSATTSSYAQATATMPPTGPWWRHPMMWVVVGGPAIVVAASFVTLSLAISHADPVVAHNPDGTGAKAPAEDATDHSHAAAAMQPSLKARNHAATGGQEH